MAAAPTTYRRLPGRGGAAFLQFRLYLGPDHLLLVSSNGYSEDYHRLSYRDIQAITVRTTITGRIWTGFAACLVLGSAAIGLQMEDAGAIIAWLIVAGIFLGLLALNLFSGPTCRCEIKTAVQTRPLPSLGRLRRARRVLTELRSIIAAAQESMTPEELSQRIEQARGAGTARTTQSVAPVTSQPAASALPPVS